MSEKLIFNKFDPNIFYLRNLIAKIGPGILLAGAAIGVSHLVQSTRAGAEYGYILLPALLLACLSKYPFMLFAAQFTAVEQKDVLQGYAELGKWPVRIYYLIHFSSMFIILAAVSLVTAGIVSFLTSISVNNSALLILSFNCFLLWLGHYRGLDFFMKIIISILSIVTLIAVLLALGIDKNASLSTFDHPELFTSAGLGFLVAFMGWMPIPIDASVWHSIWTTQKIKSSSIKSRKSTVIWDFNIGYIAASIIAILFFLLGILILFGSGQQLSDSSVVFVKQFVNMYAKVLGTWSKYFVSVAALFTMISTTLAVADAYPRVTTNIIRRNFKLSVIIDKHLYNISLLLIAMGAYLVIFYLPDSLGVLVDFAAGMSFITSPFLAYFNYRLIIKLHHQQKIKLSSTLISLSFFSLAVLILLSLTYILIFLW